MEEKKEIQIELSDEVAEGIYSNLAIISHAPSEFVIDFIRMTPGAPKAPVKSRIILTAEHAKRLLFALQDNIRKYEAQFENFKCWFTSFFFDSGECTVNNFLSNALFTVVHNVVDKTSYEF